MTDVDAVWYPEQSLCPLPQQLSRSAPPEGATSAMAVAARVLPSLEVAVLDAKPTDALRYGIERMCSSIFPAGQTRVDAGAAEPDALPDSLDLLAMRAAPELARITLHVARPDEPLALGVDESYHLVVQRHAAALSAGTVWGLLRGLETFAQLAHNGFVVGVPLDIQDAPRFPWRGLLLDTARHFMPVDTILETLDAMATAKLNVLHWHITDAESFPLDSGEYPLRELAASGALGAGKRYSRANVQAVVQRARQLGVRVVPEIDLPAHTHSWGRAFPDLVMNCTQTAAHLHEFALDPLNERTYEVVAALLDQVTQLFPDPFLHLGGDEVNLNCWREDARVSAHLFEHNLEPRDLLQRFTDRVLHMARDRGRRVVLWGDAFRALQLPPWVVAQTWVFFGSPPAGPVTYANELLSGRAVLSSVDWYLDHDDSWEHYHRQDPLATAAAPPYNVPTFLHRNALGGEAAMWSEHADHTNLHCRVWPRALAAAERLWSGQNVTQVPGGAQGVAMRMGRHARRLRARGIAAAPMPSDLPPAAEPQQFTTATVYAPGKPRAARSVARVLPACPGIPRTLHRPLRWAEQQQFRQVLVLTGPRPGATHGAAQWWPQVAPRVRDMFADVVLLLPRAPGWRGGRSLAELAAAAGFPFAVEVETVDGPSMVIMSVAPVATHAAADSTSSATAGLLIADIAPFPPASMPAPVLRAGLLLMSPARGNADLQAEAATDAVMARRGAAGSDVLLVPLVLPGGVVEGGGDESSGDGGNSDEHAGGSGSSSERGEMASGAGASSDSNSAAVEREQWEAALRQGQAVGMARVDAAVLAGFQDLDAAAQRSGAHVLLRRAGLAPTSHAGNARAAADKATGVHVDPAAADVAPTAAYACELLALPDGAEEEDGVMLCELRWSLERQQNGR